MKLDGNGVASGTFAGTAVYVDMSGQETPTTITVYPGAGCTCIVETCNMPGAADTPPADSYWEAWSYGAVTATKSDALTSRVSAIRFRRTAGAATCEFVVRGGEQA